MRKVNLIIVRCFLSSIYIFFSQPSYSIDSKDSCNGSNNNEEEKSLKRKREFCDRIIQIPPRKDIYYQSENKRLMVPFSETIDRVRYGNYEQRNSVKEYLLEEYTEISRDKESWHNYKKLAEHFKHCGRDNEERELGKQMYYRVDEVFIDEILEKENPLEHVKTMYFKYNNSKDKIFYYYSICKRSLKRISESTKGTQQLEAAIFLTENFKESSGLKRIKRIAEDKNSSQSKQFEAAKYLCNCKDIVMNEAGKKILKEIGDDPKHTRQKDAQKTLKEVEGWCSIM